MLVKESFTGKMKWKMIIKKIRHFLKQINKQFIIDTGNEKETVFLAGTGRSGTTWIEEVINYRKDYRILFEPFHTTYTPILKDWNYRQYIRPDNKEDKYLIPAAKILRGQVKNIWIDQFNTSRMYQKRIVKDIRANLFLKWLHQNFPEIPIVLILRHPCAVASSKLALGWDTHLEEFLSQDMLIQDFLYPFVQEIQNASDPFEKHIFLWCVENYLPLMQFQPEEIHVIFFERFYLNPEKSIQNLMNFIHGKYDAGIMEQVCKPSALSRQDSAIVTNSKVLEAWRKKITPDQTNRAVEILSLFGLDKIYNRDTIPLVNAEETLNMFSNKSFLP